MGPLDLTSKTAAIVIVLTLMGVSLVASVGTAFFPQTHDLSARFTETFFGLMGTLMIALNVSDKHTPPPAAPAGQ